MSARRKPGTATRRRAAVRPAGSARAGTATLRLDAAPGTAALPARAFAALAAVAGLAFAGVALAIIGGPHRLGDYMTETDFYGAYAQGARLVQHGVLDPSRYGVIGPGYEIALALAGFVVRDLFRAAEYLSLVSALATLLLWHTLLRRRLGPGVACFAVLFITTNAHFLRFAYSAATDAFSIALESLALFLLLGAKPAGERDGATVVTPRRLFAAGLAAAAAFLTRYNAVALVPAGFAAIGLGAVVAHGAPPGAADAGARRARAALAFALGFGAPVVPWVLWSLAHGGSFSFQLHHNIAYEVFARARGIPWDDYQKTLQPQFHNLWDVIARDPKAVFGRMALNVFDHLRLDATKLLGVPVAVAAWAGVALGALDGTLRRLWPAWLAAGLLFLTLVPVFYAERYSLALLPMYAALAGTAFASPRLALALRGGRVWLKPALALIPLAAAAGRSRAVQARVFDQLPVEVLTAADTLRAHARPGDRVIARKSHIAYHGGVEALAFPFADSLPQLASYAHANHARWIYFSWPEAETRPKLWYLLDTAAVVPGLVPRAVTRPHPAVLYEVGPEFGRTPPWMRNDTLLIWHRLRAQVLVDSRNTSLLYNLAVVSRAAGRLDEAASALDRLLALAPGNLQATLLLGDVLLEQRHANEAAQAWRPVIDATGDPGTLARMVELFTALGDAEAAARARAALARRGGTR